MSSQATAGIETRVNTYTTAYQTQSSVTTLADGGWIVTWTSYDQDGDGDGIYQQRYSANGTTRGHETRVNSYVTSYQQASSVSALADGGWIVTWASYGQDGDHYGIYQQRYNANGKTNGVETQVNSHVTGRQIESSVTVLADGGWVVTWTSDGQDGDGYGVYQQRYNASGAARGAETRVNTYLTSDQFESSATALADGGWIVTWSSYGVDGDGYGISQQRYAANGAARGAETRINTYTTNFQMGSSATALADGGWVVTWSSAGQDGGVTGSGIYQQRYGVDGTTSGAETRVNTYTTDTQFAPSVAALADGGWIATWTSSGQDGSRYGVYQQRYDLNGVALGGETRVNVYTDDDQVDSSVTAQADGGWVVTWSSYNQDGSVHGVYQRHFAADVLGTALSDKRVGTHWDETLIGFSGNDRLDGKGGNDILIGGYGNDTYIVNSAGDVVQELANQGTDTVLASISYILTSSVENLTLTGAKNINGTGNGLANVLTGNAKNNTLSGLGGNDVVIGGKGNDILTGGSGSDRFVFHTGDGKDTITDFNAKGAQHDIIDLRGVTSITDFADLKAHHMTATGSNIVIDATNGDTITLHGVSMKDLDSSDFLF